MPEPNELDRTRTGTGRAGMPPSPPARTPSVPLSAPGGRAAPSVPIRSAPAPAPASDRERWEQDRAAARQLGRAIRRSNTGEGPVHRSLPPEVPHGEDLGVSSVTAEFSAAMVRRGVEERALNAAAARSGAAAEVDEPTNATLMLDQEQLRQAMQAAGKTPPAQTGPRRPVWAREQVPRRRTASTTVKASPKRPAAAETAAAAPAATVRTRTEAEAELYQSVHDDHLFLNNPVLVRGLGLAPAIVAAVNGRTALLLSLAAALLLIATRVLTVALCHLFGNRQRPLLYLFAAAMAYVPVYCLLYRVFGGELTVLGIYLPLLVADPLIVKRMEAPELESVDEAWWRGVNNAGGQALALLLIGTLRELLAAGTVFGAVILADAPLPLAGQPAGGFMLVGLLAAVWTAVGGAYVHYKREEVRYLYADRKQ